MKWCKYTLLDKEARNKTKTVPMETTDREIDFPGIKLLLYVEKRYFKCKFLKTNSYDVSVRKTSPVENWF